MRGESNEDQKIAAFGSSYMESRRIRTQLGRVSARLLLILILEPVGRLSGRDSYGESIERRCSEANRRRCPRMNPERRNPSLSEGRTSGHRPLVPLGRLPKGLAVRAKPPAATPKKTDIHPRRYQKKHPSCTQYNLQKNPQPNPHQAPTQTSEKSYKNQQYK